MKKALVFLVALCFAIPVLAQDCKGYYYLLNNAEIEMTILDAKGVASGKTIYKVTNVRKDGAGTVSDFTNTFYDKSNKQVTSGTGQFKCSGNGVAIDMKMSVPSMPQMKDMKMEGKTNASFLDYPSGMHAGQELPGGTFEMNGNVKGMEMGISYVISNRKVLGKEKVTTPAGSWDCFKIAYDINFEMKMMGQGIPMKFSAIEWFALDFGPVKTSSSKDGKDMGGTMITALKK
ncbi:MULTISPECIES: TapB family protein [unclassified Chitinophaga]|uniref:TapB family protein n=1 Tax=unclassified Chitinophaga TaxID=2619133 RepID=UPI0030101E6C